MSGIQKLVQDGYLDPQILNQSISIETFMLIGKLKDYVASLDEILKFQPETPNPAALNIQINIAKEGIYNLQVNLLW